MLRTIGVGFVAFLMSCVCGAQQMSTVCTFTHGPAAGTTHDYAPLAPAPVGTRCNDGKGSTGSVVPAPATPQQPAPANAGDPASANPPASPTLSTLCRFTEGPEAGTTHDYAPIDPLPVGTSCNNGRGSIGAIIAKVDDPPAGAPVPAVSTGVPQQMSTLCSFNHGPAAGSTHDYAPLDPLPVGTPCNDGKGSTGTVIARADNPAASTTATTNQPMSTVCSFNQGPAAGSSHDYAPLDPLPVGAACNDGKGSTGMIVAKPPDPAPAAANTAAGTQETSTLCRFSSGPVTGTTHDYAPLDPLPVGTACNDGAGSTGIIIARSTTPSPPSNSPAYAGPGPASTTSPAPSYAGPGSQPMSTLCKFSSGPAAGTLHDYAPLDPIPVGSTCNDGKGSTGLIIPKPPRP